MGGARRGARCGLRRYSLGMRHHHRTTADIEQDARGLLCGSGRRRGAVILCCAGAGAPHAPLPRCVVVVTRVLLPPPQLRGSSLAGARILFSGVFPRDVAPAVVREMPLYRAALGCGARIVGDYSGAGPTHVVARFGGTEKVHQVCARWHTRVFGAAPWQMQHARTRTARARAGKSAARVHCGNEVAGGLLVVLGARRRSAVCCARLRGLCGAAGIGAGTPAATASAAGGGGCCCCRRGCC